ncbi:MAG TPA: hypothetical protein PLW24_16475, partial [Burkholderiaceae bacterium]|nr:hypothetical protein [Burkholderiaceae bacterium]
TAQRRLDLLASVRATAQRAGLFTPVHRQQRETPEFLFLIDRLRGGDQQAHWAAELARDLAAEGVLLHLYEYDRDPRWVAPLRTQRSAAPTPTQRYRPLATLAARHAGQGLVLLGDGLGCLDPVAGQLQSWVKDCLAPWPRRVLMTPRPTDSWGPAEDLLAGEGQPAHLPSFLVLPMQIDAWPAAAHWLCQGELAGLAVLPGAPADYPALLRDDPQRWLAGGPPADGELLALVGQLRAWLGPTAYTWLAAGAAYPHHSAELTAYLAHALDDALDIAPGNAPPGGSDAPSVPATDARLFEARLIAIAQLPWSRHGLMPDWLRRALLLSLPPPVRIQVRTALTRLFLTAADERAAAAGWSLGVVATDAANTSTPAWWRRLRRRIGLGGVVESEPADSPLRDVIYLGMLRGDFDRELSLAAPAAFTRAARAGQGTRLSWNPLRWAAAVLLSLWFLLRIGGWQVVASTAVGFLLPQATWFLVLFATVWVLIVVLPLSVMRGVSWRWLPPSAGVLLGLLLGWLFPTANPLLDELVSVAFSFLFFVMLGAAAFLFWLYQRLWAPLATGKAEAPLQKGMEND